jgi:hypothetical protein
MSRKHGLACTTARRTYRRAYARVSAHQSVSYEESERYSGGDAAPVLMTSCGASGLPLPPVLAIVLPPRPRRRPGARREGPRPTSRGPAPPTSAVLARRCSMRAGGLVLPGHMVVAHDTRDVGHKLGGTKLPPTNAKHHGTGPTNDRHNTTAAPGPRSLSNSAPTERTRGPRGWSSRGRGPPDRVRRGLHWTGHGVDLPPQDPRLHQGWTPGQGAGGRGSLQRRLPEGFTKAGIQGRPGDGGRGGVRGCAGLWRLWRGHRTRDCATDTVPTTWVPARLRPRGSEPTERSCSHYTEH